MCWLYRVPIPDAGARTVWPLGRNGQISKSQHVGIGGSGNVSDTRKIVNVSLAMLTPCAYPSFFDSVCVAHSFFSE